MSSYTGTVLITGGTHGLGYQAALSAAKQHPEYRVIVASRTDTNSAAAAINKETGNNNAAYLPLDLSSLAKVRSFANDYMRRGYPPIKALLLNAALQMPGKIEYSTDGIEKTFAINHLGHALLYYLLRLEFANDIRIVITSSGTHDPAQKSGMPEAEYPSAEKLAHPDPATATKDGRQRYTTSKLCNVLWAYALHRRLSRDANVEKKWTVTLFEPGLVPGTGLGRNYSPVLKFIWKTVLPRILPLLRLLISPNIHTAQESGGSLAYVATSRELEGVSGVYFEGRKEIKTSVLSYDEDRQEDLYDWTVKAIATGQEEVMGFQKVYG